MKPFEDKSGNHTMSPRNEEGSSSHDDPNSRHVSSSASTNQEEDPVNDNDMQANNNQITPHQTTDSEIPAAEIGPSVSASNKPIYFKTIRHYHDITETKLPFAFKPLQIGPQYYSQVFLFDVDRLKVYIPKLFNDCPSLQNYKKVILKLYDIEYLESDSQESTGEDDYDPLKEASQRFINEVKSLKKIQNHNNKINDPLRIINVPRLFGFGFISFATFSIGGPINLSGDFLLMEYIEPDAEVNDYNNKDYFGYIKLTDDLYKDGIRQLDELKRLRISHTDISEGKHLIVSGSKLYFIGFHFSGMVSKTDLSRLDRDKTEFEDFYTKQSFNNQS